MSEPAEDQKSFQTAVHMGLGDAIEQLIRTQIKRSMGVFIDSVLLDEQKMIVHALNQHDELNLGFDCNMDGVPDTVAIFAMAAETSCCRILAPEERPKKTRGTSRASSTTKKK